MYEFFVPSKMLASEDVVFAFLDDDKINIEMLFGRSIVSCMENATSKVDSKYKCLIGYSDYQFGDGECNYRVIIKGFDLSILSKLIYSLVNDHIEYFKELINATKEKPLILDNKNNNRLINTCNGIISRLNKCKNNKLLEKYVN